MAQGRWTGAHWKHVMCMGQSNPHTPHACGSGRCGTPAHAWPRYCSRAPNNTLIQNSDMWGVWALGLPSDDHAF
eukprot:364383-Chlamydomonas_euryale.AAC.2